MRRSAENRLVDALETRREGVMLVAPDGQIVLANSTLRGFFPAIADQLVPRHPVRRRRCALIQSQLCADAKASLDITTSGHAELELADGRWLRMTGSATSEGGSIFFLPTSPPSRSARKACAAPSGGRSRQRRQDPLPGQYEP